MKTVKRSIDIRSMIRQVFDEQVGRNNYIAHLRGGDVALKLSVRGRTVVAKPLHILAPELVDQLTVILKDLERGSALVHSYRDSYEVELHLIETRSSKLADPGEEDIPNCILGLIVFGEV
jgi:hypothetical protein